MNIFVVDLNPVIAAQNLCDRHSNGKMAIEALQMLSTIQNKLGYNAPMKSTHENHPCTKWVGETKENFEWLIEHARALFNEYTFRYGKIHASQFKLDLIEKSRIKPKKGHLTPFAQAFVKRYPELVSDDIVNSYRMYYIVDKSRFAKWTHGRSEPLWWKEMFLSKI